jgi:hypothetical protein
MKALFLLLTCVFGWEDTLYNGSLDGYFSPSEVVQLLGNLTESFGSLVRTGIAGKSYLKADIPYAELYSSEGMSLSDRAGVLVTAGQSSMQPLAVSQALYLLSKFANLYASDDRVKYILQTQRLYFLPMINRDAYQALTDTYARTGQLGQGSSKNLHDVGCSNNS